MPLTSLLTPFQFLAFYANFTQHRSSALAWAYTVDPSDLLVDDGLEDGAFMLHRESDTVRKARARGSIGLLLESCLRHS